MTHPKSEETPALDGIPIVCTWRGDKDSCLAL
jgi:hypothetical protein